VLSLLILLLFKSFPKQVDFNKVSAIEDSYYDLNNERDFIFRIETTNFSVIKDKTRKKLNDNHSKRKVLLSYRIYNTVKKVLIQ